MSLFFIAHRAGLRGLANVRTELRIDNLGNSNGAVTYSRSQTNRVYVNWGCGTIHGRLPEDRVLLNRPSDVNAVGNKRRFFESIDRNEVRIPDFTTSRDTAADWVTNGDTAVLRHTLRGHSGDGIELFTPEDYQRRSLPVALLYTKYKKKRDEYRVHVFQGRVISVQRKAIVRGTHSNQIDFRVRTHSSGFVFVRDIENPTPGDVFHQALAAMEQVDLDFGAVDVIWNQREGLAYVLEINTAPGLVNTTARDYAAAFDHYHEEQFG